MPPKVGQKTKEQKMKAAMSGGKGKKKKWSKGKTKEKLMLNILMNKAIESKMKKDIPKLKLITPSIVSEKLKVNGSVARAVIRHLDEEGSIKPVGDLHHTLLMFTRATAPIEAEEEAPTKGKKKKGGD